MTAAGELFLTKGYENTTLKAIRSRAQVSNGSLFYGFPTKSALAEAICLEALGSRFDALRWSQPHDPNSLIDVMRCLVRPYLIWTADNRDAARLVTLLVAQMGGEVASARITKQTEWTNAKIVTCIEPLITSGKMRDTPAKVVSALVFGPVHALCLGWLSGLGETPPPAYEDTLVEAVCAALQPPPPAIAVPPAKSSKRNPRAEPEAGDLFHSL